ncbi:hypothetical protein [Mycobacterium sherrisii]|uniref:hypothetical protein n=1 Tax=Mycobacterium sherrisii TaxID=243061 RepID=UPI000A15E35A|nr:hypothetical protein [Mycobacterium sherrisii]MCV7030857.1 hypothetical protein [Mycobacterium sherrisii]ORW75130.1 hypothetical protein AWC25_14670 [Mycobacterium sherrisii]
MKEPINWVRAVFFGGIAGGFFWAVMLALLVPLSHRHTSIGYFYTMVTAVSIGVLAVGVVLYSRARTSVWRSRAIGIILAPLTGGSILLIITLAVVLPKQGVF